MKKLFVRRPAAPAEPAGARPGDTLPSPISPQAFAALSDEEKRLYRPVPRRYERLPVFAWVMYGVFALCVLLYILQGLSEAFADAFNGSVGAFVRGALAFASSFLPFSLGEMTVLLMPVIVGLVLWYGIRRRCDTWRSAMVYAASLLAAAATVFSVFVLGFSAGYRGSSLDKKLNLTDEAVSPEELYDTALILVNHINEETANVAFYHADFSAMPYSVDEMNRLLSEAYADFCTDYDFIRNNAGQAKPALVSEVLSYMHITGVYSFFTGEANLNVGFPDYTLPYTAAHEMAHQRGVARENEANMTAFLVCIRSSDSYIRYSAYLNMYEYVASALYSADRDLYRQAYARLNPEVRAEMSAYSAFYDKYRESTAAKVSGTVNNAYLQTQKVEVGTKSYGMVVDLTVAYYKAHPEG